MRRAREAELARRSLNPVPEGAWFAQSRHVGASARVVRGTVWAGLLTGPAALLVCWAMAAAPDGPPVRPQEEAPAAAALEPAGWAERAVAAYVDGDAEAVRAAFPSATDSQLPQESDPQPGAQTTAVSAEKGAEDWTVTVAVSQARTDAQSPRERYFSLGVVRSGTGWVAPALPSEIAAPVAEGAPELVYASRPLAGGALTDTVAQWARAYLTETGELDRYLHPGFTQDPLAPTPYTSVEVRSVQARTGHEDAADGAPADGAVVDVLATVEATDEAGRQWPLSYAVQMTGRSDRWEVSALSGAPHREPGPHASPAATASRESDSNRAGS